MRRRTVSKLLVMIGLMTALSGVVEAAPAQAAAQNCFNGSGPTTISWSTQNAKNFSRGAFCIDDSQRTGYRLVWQADGNLVAYNNASANTAASARFSSATAGRGYRLSLQVDGNMVVYDSASRPLWASGASSHRTSLTSYNLWIDSINLIGDGTHEYVFIEQYQPYAMLWNRRIS